MVSLAGTPLPWREKMGTPSVHSQLPRALMNAQGAGTHPLQHAALRAEKAPDKEDKHIALSLGVNTRKVKGQLQLNWAS